MAQHSETVNWATLFRVYQRAEKTMHVNIDPGTDWWMRGARHGIVTGVGRKWVHVRLYANGACVRHKPFKFAPDLLTLAE